MNVRTGRDRSPRTGADSSGLKKEIIFVDDASTDGHGRSSTEIRAKTASA